MICLLVFGLAILMSCTGCAPFNVAGVKTPEPWRADLQTPEGRVPGVVRQTAWANKQFLPIVSNNLSTIANEQKEDWDAIAARAGIDKTKYPVIWK